jgi:hypothetical protein
VGCLVASVAFSGAGPMEAPSAPAQIPEAARFDAPTENPSRSRPRPAVAVPEQVRIDVARWTGPDGLGITLAPAAADGARPSAPI